MLTLLCPMSNTLLSLWWLCFQTYSPCGCKASSSSLISGNGAGWEGTALLHHGSYIKLGCLQFVFSIVDHAPDLPILAMPETLLPPSSSSSSLASTLTTTKFSSMPLLSSSQYLHGQPPVSLLKTHLKSSSPPWQLAGSTECRPSCWCYCSFSFGCFLVRGWDWSSGFCEFVMARHRKQFHVQFVRLVAGLMHSEELANELVSSRP